MKLIHKEDCDIDTVIALQKKIIPDLHEIFMKRYDILRLIHYYQPVGRRQLSSILGIGERVIRGEVALMKNQGLIEIRAEGMNTTAIGENTLEGLSVFIHRFKGLRDLEEEVGERLQIKKVIVVPEMIQDGEIALKEIGKAAANYLKSTVQSKMIIGITGGSTMAAVAEEMGKEQGKFQDVIVVPARGGLGKDVDKQANTIAAKIAGKLGGTYKLLYMPDNIDKNVFSTLSEDPVIKDVMEYIEKIQVLIFGIGRADKMAIRRGLSPAELQDLAQKGAVSEAFGYYFNRNGEIIREVNTIGVSLKKFKELKLVIGAAAGAEKAEAVVAISRLNANLVLVIDESLAREILKIK
ncbi:sugar-binding transcriptional regulator [Thermotalea metallivorans]|uniref:Central glycolytic genes regulator n=1 Tax=Thermotalea metallivorans TaxID=520762 RepID=A0A140LEA0_9FIRM|nr:sugar-binding domain-containing protein [Thermotalea metallivorans]KXG78875.1 Central glycolytic genes regulator [Thermotalea metallivorans]